MFIRGGIHFGERVYKDSDTEISEAYYKAYTLERRVVFPVIGINADFARKLPRLSGFHQHANIPSQGRPNDNYVVTTKLKMDIQFISLITYNASLMRIMGTNPLMSFYAGIKLPLLKDSKKMKPKTLFL